MQPRDIVLVKASAKQLVGILDQKIAVLPKGDEELELGPDEGTMEPRSGITAEQLARTMARFFSQWRNRQSSRMGNGPSVPALRR